MPNSINQTKISSTLLTFLVLTLPFERIFAFEFSGYTIKLSYIFGILLLLYFLYQIIRDKITISLYKEEIYLLLFVFLTILTTWWSIDWPRSKVISLMILFSASLFFALRRLIDFDSRQKLFSLFIIIGFLVSTFALWQFFVDKTFLSHFSFLRPEYTSAVFGFPRVQSTFLEPLYLANFLLIPIFLSIYILITKPLFKNYLYLIFIATAFFLTLSRGAFLALAVSLVLFLVIMAIGRTGISKLIRPFLIIILSFGIAVLSILSVGGRNGLAKYFGHAAIDDIATGESVIDRKDTMRISTKQFYLHPFGIGAGAFGALPQFRSDIASEGYQTVNNLYLEILAEEGFLGLLFFVLFLIYYLINMVRGDTKDKLFLMVSLSLITALLIQYLFFSTLYIIYIWVVLAMLSPKLAQNHKS